MHLQCIIQFYIKILQQTLSSRIMKRTTSILQNSLSKTSSNLSESYLFSHCDSSKQISDCTTVISQLQFMEEMPRSSQYQDLDTSFRKQLVNTALEASTYNPNAKKSKILIVESRIISEPQVEKKEKELSRQMDELQSIEKKTQDLAMKQRQQRRQLKKLKKMYLQKLDQLVKQQQSHSIQTNNLKTHIEDLTQQKKQLITQKEVLQKNISKLEGELQVIHQEIKSISIQRQHLTHRLQLFQTNFQKRDKDTCIEEEQSTQDLDREIEIIDKTIKNCKKHMNNAGLNQLLQLKIQLLEKRQTAKLHQQTKKQNKLIAKLNQIISSRNNLVKSKNMAILQLSNGKKPSQDQGNLKDEKQLETSDSFFNKQAFQKEEKVDQDDDIQQWDQFKHSVRKLIESNRIVGHEECYQAIQSIVLGMIHLFENETCCEEDVLQLLDISLDSLNNKFVSKARNKVNRIQNIFSSMNNGNSLKENIKTPQQK